MTYPMYTNQSRINQEALQEIESLARGIRNGSINVTAYGPATDKQGIDSLSIYYEVAKKPDKPSWNDAPEWAMWLAQDDTGEWYWYSYPPEYDEGIWIDASEDGINNFAMEGPEPENPRNTIEYRPEL